MNLKALRAFHLIVERGSLAAAASDLYLSQPAVSRLVALLEEELDLRLFNRAGRSLSMTKDGAAFYEATTHILAGLEEIPRIAKDIQTSNKQLQLITTFRIAQGVVSPAVALMRKENPKLRFRVDVLSRIDLDNLIGMRRFDLAIASLPVTHSLVAIDNRPLFKVRLEAVLPKDHALASRSHVTASDLGDQELIGLWQDQLWRKQMDEFMRSSGRSAKYVVETRSSLMACQMASDGAGIAILDRLSARGLDLRGVEFRPLEPALWIAFGYFHQGSEPLTGNALSFIDYVRRTVEEFRESSPENAASAVLSHGELEADHSQEHA